MEKDKTKGKRIFQVILLISSFLIIAITSYFFLANYTTFLSQGVQMLAGANQSINPLILAGFSVGLILFGIFVITSKRFKQIVRIFLLDAMLTMIYSALFILGVFVPYPLEFRLALIISSFIIYFIQYIVKEMLENKKED